MQITTSELIEFNNTAAELEDQKIEFNTALKIAKLYRVGIKLLSEIQSKKNILIRECLKTDETGNYIQDNDGLLVREEKAEYFKTSLEELNAPQQIPDIYFTENELSKIELTLKQINSFIPFIK